MKAVDFKGANCVFAERQGEYLDLPAYKHGDDVGNVSSCWKLNLWERIKTLATGKIYVTMRSFGKPLTPIRLDTNSPIEEEKNIGKS